MQLPVVSYLFSTWTQAAGGQFNFDWHFRSKHHKLVWTWLVVNPTVLDGEPDESRPSSPVEKGEDVVCTLQPKTPSEQHILIESKQPDPNSNCPEECPEAFESHTCSLPLVHKILPQLSIVEEETSDSLEVASPTTPEKVSEKSEIEISESLEPVKSKCLDIDSPPEVEELCETSEEFITPFVNQESEICHSFHDTTPSPKCSENQEDPCEITLNVVEPNELSEVSTNTNQQSSELSETPVLQKQSKLLTTTPQLEPAVDTDLSVEKQVTFESRVEQLEEFAAPETERLSEQGSNKDLHSEESLIEPQIEPELNFVTEKATQNSVAVKSMLIDPEITAELSETKILVEGELLESLSNSVSSKEEKPHSSEESDPLLTEKSPVVPPASSAAEEVLLPDPPLTMESLTTGTEMLSISSLEDNLGSSREVSPSSDDLLETLAYVPDLDDTEDVDLEIDECDLADDESKVLENSENGELDSLESSGSPPNMTNDNSSAAPVPATNNNPPTTTDVPSGEATTAATAPSTTTANNNNNKKKSKKNVVTNNNATTTTTATVTTTAVATTESSKADNKNNNANQPAKSEPKRVDSKPQKSNSKNKKKDDKDHILRALSSLSTPEEKLAALCKKYADLHEENRELGTNAKQNQRKLAVLTRQKEQLQLENNKAVMAKSQLESLCRELQKHNRLIKEESLARAKEEDEKRKEISAKFQTTINEIQAQMVDNHDRNMKLREENTELASKLKTFLEQYEQREKYFEKIVKHRELEQQLADAKLKQASMQLLEEKEKNTKEREFMLMKATETDTKMILLEKQVKTYKDQYSEFQSTITKSNDMFSKLRGEMDKMTVKIKKLEKDSAAWKSKWENCNKALLGMIDQKTMMDKERMLLHTKIQKLESLCRAQQDRLRAQKSPPPQPEECHKCCFAEHASTPSSNDNMPAEPAQAPVTDSSSSKTEVAADQGTPPAESCVTPATGPTVPATDSLLPDPQPKEIPSATVSECSAASSSIPESTTNAETTTNATPAQSCHSNSSVGDNSNCCSTNKEDPSSDNNKPAPLVDHTAPVKSCTQTT